MIVTEWSSGALPAVGDVMAGEGADIQPDASQIGPGSLGFWIVIGLMLVLILLYRSMRKQIRRVNFDTGAATDEDRVASHHEPHDQADHDQADHDHKHDETAKSDEAPKHDHPS